MRRAAAYYDAIYTAMKDYAAEAARVDALIREHGRSGGQRLLDVACGTGLHLTHLRDRYDVEGLDLEPDMLAVARERLPGVPLHQADMLSFELGHAFDAVTCLFSAIGYVRTIPRLRRAIRTMRNHLRPGGVLIVEPWITPDRWFPGVPYASFVDLPELKVARLNVSRSRGRLSILDLHYLVATPRGVERFVERLRLGLFTHEEYLDAFHRAGLAVRHDPEGLMGRGLYVGVAPGP